MSQRLKPSDFIPKNSSCNGHSHGHNGVAVEEPPAPPTQKAPPDDPPEIGDGDGDGGDDGGSGYSGGFGFPDTPPRGMPKDPSPLRYTMLSRILAPNSERAYVVATVPLADVMGNIASPHASYGAPPPVAFAYYVYPVQFLEIETRQYYAPPSPAFSCDYSPERLPTSNMIAQEPVVLRRFGFHIGYGGQIVMFEPGTLDTPFSDWRLVTAPYGVVRPKRAIRRAAWLAANYFLRPSWLMDPRFPPGTTPACPPGFHTSQGMPSPPPMQPYQVQQLRQAYHHALHTAPVFCADADYRHKSIYPADDHQV